MTHVSIILSVGNRPTHLRNSLQSWSLINYPDFDFILIDNGSGNHEIEKIARDFEEKLHLTFYQEPEILNVNVAWNKYGKASKGEYVVFTMMDEIVANRDILQRMMEIKDRRASVFTYFMNQQETDQLANLPWQNDPQIIPKPWTDATSAGLWSHITGAWREYWEWFGWFRNDDRGHLWVEQDVHIREVCLGKGAETPLEIYCLHQAHPSALPSDWARPGYKYKNEMQARLLEPAERDAT